MINVYAKNETSFEHNGLVVLNDCKSCFITEELNGSYYLELEYPKDARGKYLNLEGLNIIKADGQLFRIPLLYKVQDTGVSIKVRADHIFYDLNYDFIEDLNIVDKSIQGALPLIVNNPKFNIVESDQPGTITMGIQRANPVQVLFSIIENMGGELCRDNFNIGIKSTIGQNSGYLISYGKNITGFEQTLDYSNLATRIMPTGKDGITINLVNGGSKYLDSPRINDYPFIITKEVQFTDIDDAGELMTRALKLWGNVDLPIINYKVNILDIMKTEEFKQLGFLMNLHVGDTVLIKHRIFKANLTARVIKTKKNVLTNRLEQIELGQFRNNIADTLLKMGSGITNISKELQTTRSQVQQTNDRIALVITQDGKIMPASIEASINSNGSLIVLKADKIKFDTDGSGTGKGIVDIANGVLTVDAIKALNLSVGNEIQMGSEARISWNNVDDQPSIPTQYTDQDALDAINVTYIDANGIWTPVVYAKNISTLLGKIAAAQIEDLIVGTNVTMGPNARISWNNVDNQPSIPSQYTDTLAVNAIKNTYIDGSNIWTINVYAQNVKAGEIAGVTLRTIPVGQSGAHIKIYEKYIDFVDANGSSVFQIGIDMPNAESGKPQLFFSNGCSLDTFEGDIRVRTSATNYVRVNSEAHGGGVDYINGQSTISLDGGGVTYAVFS